mgnify:FL=1|tara:strand:- start:495 stop:662 length:168 start_codon:yes stop_codon:yes gene_type:complete
MVKISGLDKKGHPTDIYYNMPQEALPELINHLLSQDGIILVSIEKEKEDEDEDDI